MITRTNEEWLRELASEGEEQTSALADLHAYLLRAALYSLGGSRSNLVQQVPVGIEQLAEDSAQDALLAILKHLHEFRGDSKFTTWAYKFAINVALTAARHERWKHVSLDEILGDTDRAEWEIQDERLDHDPDRMAAQGEVWGVMREAIDRALTDRQRQVLKAIVFDDVPMDEIVRRLGTNRNAVYKLLHDARRKIKAHLETRGFGVEEVFDLFSART